MKPKTVQEIEIMREGGRRTAKVLNQLAAMVEPGISPKEIAREAAALMKQNDLQVMVLGYGGFPDVMCISVNENVVHGVPSGKKLAQGDVVKLDLTPAYKNLVLDTAVTVVAGGKPPATTRRLLEGTQKALYAGIDAIKGDGTRVGDISAAIQKVLEDYNLGIIRDLVGHGVGYGIHEDPNIPNYGIAGTGPLLHAGMTLAIEPITSLGDWRIVETRDGQTIAMADGSLSANFEHTVLITQKSAEILTLAA